VSRIIKFSRLCFVVFFADRINHQSAAGFQIRQSLNDGLPGRRRINDTVQFMRRMFMWYFLPKQRQFSGKTLFSSALRAKTKTSVFGYLYLLSIFKTRLTDCQSLSSPDVVHLFSSVNRSDRSRFAPDKAKEAACASERLPDIA